MKKCPLCDYENNYNAKSCYACNTCLNEEPTYPEKTRSNKDKFKLLKKIGVGLNLLFVPGSGYLIIKRFKLGLIFISTYFLMVIINIFLLFFLIGFITLPLSELILRIGTAIHLNTLKFEE